MIKQVLLVLTCCAVATVRSQGPCFKAPANASHSFAAAPESCDAYIICMNGQTIRGQRCPSGMLFHPPTQTCGNSNCMECSPFGIQNLPHPTDCKQFIRCILGNKEIATCPSNLMFDRSIANCNYPRFVHCPGQPTDPPTEGPTEGPTDPTKSPTDPTESTTHTTESPTHPTESTTDPTESTTKPTEQPTLPPHPTDPPGDRPVCRGQVFHAHPYDCNRFFMCIDEVLWEHRCPNNLHWNQLWNACDLPEHARCLVGNRPPEPLLFPPKTFEHFENELASQAAESGEE